MTPEKVLDTEKLESLSSGSLWSGWYPTDWLRAHIHTSEAHCLIWCLCRPVVALVRNSASIEQHSVTFFWRLVPTEDFLLSEWILLILSAALGRFTLKTQEMRTKGQRWYKICPISHGCYGHSHDEYISIAVNLRPQPPPKNSVSRDNSAGSMQTWVTCQEQAFKKEAKQGMEAWLGGRACTNPGICSPASQETWNKKAATILLDMCSWESQKKLKCLYPMSACPSTFPRLLPQLSSED